MLTLSDVLREIGKTTRKLDGEFGIEIETETKKEYIRPTFHYWTAHNDGSLRDFGTEYVLKQPLKYAAEVNLALKEFEDKTKDIPFIKDSVTTSVHVHVNMLNESIITLGNFLTLYSMFENLLIRYSGPDRLSNLFCLPICDAEETYKVMRNLFESFENKGYKAVIVNEQTSKYAACNLSALYKYGSVEIRSFRGETDIEKIRNWVSILYRLLDYSRNEKLNPKQIIASWKDRQEKFLKDVFQDYSKEISHPDQLALIEKNLWYAAAVAFSVKNWDKFKEIAKPKEFKPTKAELDKIANLEFNTNYASLNDLDKLHVFHIAQRTWANKNGLGAQEIDLHLEVERRGAQIPPPANLFVREEERNDLGDWGPWHDDGVVLGMQFRRNVNGQIQRRNVVGNWAADVAPARPARPAGLRIRDENNE